MDDENENESIQSEVIPTPMQQHQEEPRELTIPDKIDVPTVMKKQDYDWRKTKEKYVEDSEVFLDKIESVKFRIKNLREEIEKQSVSFRKDAQLRSFINVMERCFSEYEELNRASHTFIGSTNIFNDKIVKIADEYQENMNLLKTQIEELQRILGSYDTLLADFLPILENKKSVSAKETLVAIRKFIREQGMSADARKAEWTAEKRILELRVEFLEKENVELRNEIKDRIPQSAIGNLLSILRQTDGFADQSSAKSKKGKAPSPFEDQGD